MQKNGYTFAIVYSSTCVSVFLHQTLLTSEVQAFKVDHKIGQILQLIWILQSNVCFIKIRTTHKM